jgi:hypothetical protein
MNGRTNTRVTTRTASYPTLQPTAQEDYFSYHPRPGSLTRPALKRPHIPDPLKHISYTNCSPLSAGPVGWKYTPLSARTPGFESFRHDHGVRPKTRLSCRAVVLNCRWDLLLDEDALPARVMGRCQMYLEEAYHSVKGRLANWGWRLCRFPGWLWRKLLFRRPALVGVGNIPPGIYRDDVETGSLNDIQDIEVFLNHAV